MSIFRNLQENLQSGLRLFPAVGIVGLRQSGKTTLAKQLMEHSEKEALYLDLENPADVNLLQDPAFFFKEHENDLVVLDEIHQRPELFPFLRSEIDRNRQNGRFLVLDSGSPEVLRQGLESLAGRIEYHQLFPLNISEIPPNFDPKTLWLRGGLPPALLAETDADAFRWLAAALAAYYQTDLPQLGLAARPPLTRRLVQLLATQQGDLLNINNVSRALDLSAPTVASYIDLLEAAFLIKRLPPYHTNLKKRLVKTPKIYITDSGVLHQSLGIHSYDELLRHIKLGASYETFVMAQIVSQLPNDIEPYFFRTADGSEIDLILEKNGQLWAAIEIKFSSQPKPTKGNTLAFNSLQAEHNLIVAPVEREFGLQEGKILVTNVEGALEELGIGKNNSE